MHCCFCIFFWCVCSMELMTHVFLHASWNIPLSFYIQNPGGSIKCSFFLHFTQRSFLNGGHSMHFSFHNQPGTLLTMSRQLDLSRLSPTKSGTPKRKEIISHCCVFLHVKRNTFKGLEIPKGMPQNLRTLEA